MHGQIPPVRSNAALFPPADDRRRTDALLTAALDDSGDAHRRRPGDALARSFRVRDELAGLISPRRRHWTA